MTVAGEVVKSSKEILSNDAVQNKLLGMLDALQHGAVTVGNAVVKYSPDVANAALWVIKIDCLQILASNLVIIMLSFAGYKLGNKLMKWAIAYNEAGKGSYNNRDIAYALPVSLWLVSGITGIMSIYYFLQVWIWIGIFEPKLYLAKQIITSVLHN